MSVGYSTRTGLAYVAMAGASVALVDGATDSVRHYVPSGRRAEKLVFSPSAGRVYAISSYSSDVTVIVDSLTGVAEAMNDERVTMSAGPTIVRGVLSLSPASGVGREASSVLLDISGRRVLDLKPGTNDVRALAPGVYFVQSITTDRHSSITKTVLTR